MEQVYFPEIVRRNLQIEKFINSIYLDGSGIFHVPNVSLEYWTNGMRQ